MPQLALLPALYMSDQLKSRCVNEHIQGGLQISHDTAVEAITRTARLMGVLYNDVTQRDVQVVHGRIPTCLWGAYMVITISTEEYFGVES